MADLILKVSKQTDAEEHWQDVYFSKYKNHVNRIHGFRGNSYTERSYTEVQMAKCQPQEIAQGSSMDEP